MESAAMIPFTDAHTHRKAESAGVLALRNLAYPSERTHSSGNVLFSAGIHPYDVLTRKFEPLKAYLLENRCSAVGECGLDRSIEIDFELQKQCLLRQAELAGELSLPLVLHCVRAYPEMIALKKRFGSSVSWVIHGFRGREQTARELLKHGFTLSLSSVWLRHIDKLYDCIIDSGFLLETDDGKEKIEELYPLAACLAGMDAGEFPGWQARTALLLGKEKLEKLRNAHVLVIGLGGVGGIAAEMICRAGVGRMTIADGDLIEESNRNRQIAALTSTVGKPKAELLGARLLDINPELKLTVLNEYLRDDRMFEVLGAEPYDCVLDAIDTLSPKFYLTVYCVEHGIRLISCMGSGARLDPEAIRCADISESYNCSLARAMRKRLHRHGIYKGVKVVFSPEMPVESAVVESEGMANKRSVTGTISYMPALFGCHCAAAVIREIT